MKKYTKLMLFIAAQLLILIVAFLFIKSSKVKEIDLGYGEWTSEYMNYDGSFYRLSDEFVDSGNELTALTTPGMFLPAGSYTLTADYVAGEDQKLYFDTDAIKQIKYLESGDIRLSKYTYSVAYDFDVNVDMDDFRMVFDYNGSGSFELDEVHLVSNHNRMIRLLTWLSFFFLLLDLYLFVYRKMDDEKKRTTCILGFIWLLTSVPLFMRGIFIGDDLPFHLARIEALAAELKRGIFPVRMASLWMYGYGYPTSILYGDFLLYPVALLRILHFDITASFKFCLLMMNLGTTLTGYFSFKYIFKNKNRALLLTLIYLTCGYRFATVYVRTAIGEISGMLFVPLVAAGMWGIYMYGESKKSKASILLGCGMAGIVCSHVLTTEMTVLTLAVTALIMLRKTFTPKVLKQLFAAIGICFALSAFFLIPFADYFMNTDMVVKTDYSRAYLLGIQKNGLKLAEIFTTFKAPIGNRTLTGMADRTLYSPGIFLVGGLLIAIYLLIRHKANKKIKVLSLISVIMLFLASDLFPWDIFAAKSGLGLTLAQVQFPWRYVGMSLLPLTLLLGVLSEKYEEYRENADDNIRNQLPSMGILEALCAVSALAVLFWYTGSYFGVVSEVYYHDTAELDLATAVDGGEYRLEHIKLDQFYPNYRTDGLNSFAPVSRDGFRYDVTVETGDSEGYVDFPVFAYRNYVARDDAGNKLTVTTGDENCMVRVIIPPSYSGHIFLDYGSPWYWRLSEVISIIGLLCLIAYLIRNRAGKNNY